MLWVLMRGDSNEYPQLCFYIEIWKILYIIIKYQPYLFHWLEMSNNWGLEWEDQFSKDEP